MFVTVMYSFLSRSVIDVRFFSFIQPLTGTTSRRPGPLALHFVHWCSYTCNIQCRKPRYFLKQLIFIVIVYIIIVMIVIVICPVMAFESDHKNLPCESLWQVVMMVPSSCVFCWWNSLRTGCVVTCAVVTDRFSRSKGTSMTGVWPASRCQQACSQQV